MAVDKNIHRRRRQTWKERQEKQTRIQRKMAKRKARRRKREIHDQG